MLLYHIVILALIQGISEFLPISSSGHLVLTHYLLGESEPDLCWQQNRLLDVAVHVGTLLSVMIYFRKDLLSIVKHLNKPKSSEFKLGGHIILASLPVIIIGFILQQFQFSFMCLLEVMAWMTLIFGVVLYFADKFDMKRNLSDMRLGHAFFIGLSQALALIPGVSRSGITMTSARFLGFNRVDAAKFSLLLSIVAISGAGTLSGLEIIETKNYAFTFDILVAVILAFISGLIAITLMMKWLAKASFLPFVIYRVLLGFLLLGLIYSGVL